MHCMNLNYVPGKRVLCVCVILMIIGSVSICNSWIGSEAKDDNARGLTDVDMRVYDVAFADFVKRQPKNSFTRGRQRLVVFDSTLGRVSDQLLDHLSSLTKRMFESELRAAAKDRNQSPSKVALTGYRSSTTYVIIAPTDMDYNMDMGRFLRDYPDAVAFVSACLPGYSKSGQKALLIFSVGPSDHPTWACYELGLANGNWETVWMAVGSGQ